MVHLCHLALITESQCLEGHRGLGHCPAVLSRPWRSGQERDPCQEREEDQVGQGPLRNSPLLPWGGVSKGCLMTVVPQVKNVRNGESVFSPAPHTRKGWTELIYLGPHPCWLNITMPPCVFPFILHICNYYFSAALTHKAITNVRPGDLSIWVTIMTPEPSTVPGTERQLHWSVVSKPFRSNTFHSDQKIAFTWYIQIAEAAVHSLIVILLFGGLN